MKYFKGLRKIVGSPAEYHIVKKLDNGEFQTYEIYYDNEPCFRVEDTFSLDKDMAQKITNLLNKGK